MHERHTGTLVISGEIDIGAEGYLRSRLQEHMFGQTDVVIDVGDLSFIDVSGCRVLIHAARTLPEGRRLVLLNPPSHLVRTLSLCGWVDHPRLVLDAPTAAGIGSESGCA